MGIYLATPSTSVLVESGSGNGMIFAVGEMQVRSEGSMPFETSRAVILNRNLKNI